MKARRKKYLQRQIPNAISLEYKDDATAFNGLKKGIIKREGRR
jgi:phosphoribosylaminoimidazole-succinocarboxamide synthase